MNIEKLQRLQQSPLHERRAELVKSLLATIPNEDNSREGLIETPWRIASMYDEIFKGYEQNPHEYLQETFAVDGPPSLVTVLDIPFYSHCEHHMAPFFGVAHVGYIPKKSVVGLSKIARVVEAYARRLQIQERLTDQILQTMVDVLKPMGVIVVIEAEHLCMTMRGVSKPGAKTMTSAISGVFKDINNPARIEFFDLLKTRRQ